MLMLLWVLVFLVLGLWSLAAWGVLAVLRWDPSQLGDFKALVERVPFADWLNLWLPGWQELLRLVMDLMQSLLGWLGSAGPVLVAVIWGVGALVVLGCGALLSLVVVLVRKSMATTPRQQLQGPGNGPSTRP